MDTPSQAANSISTAGSESFVDSSVVANNDQFFLLSFIIGNFFGPDLKGEGPKKSLFQRAAEGLSTYSLEQLTGGYIKTEEIEHIYYYSLRKAEKYLALKLSLLRQFFLGNLPASGTASYPQFPHMFPTHLHPHSLMDNRYKIVLNVIFINNPNTSHIGSKDINSALYDVTVHEAGPDVEWPPTSTHHFHKRAKHADSILQARDLHVYDVQPLNCVPSRGLPPSHSCITSLPASDSGKSVEESPRMVFLPSGAKKEEWDSLMAACKSGLGLTGTAAMGQVRQTVGLVDIGECEDAYLFRVSLPGVRQDDNEFSCKIENDGKVLIKGITTTGEKTVYRFSQKFEMLSRKPLLTRAVFYFISTAWSG
ncbi:INCREASED DNA METHYLATION 2 [Salix purpurea]|uniref:INCREASED DNA METHYLATION 2 n=1 Tax=Salix purpurea TaxID=77065 RepID=A0A9Q0W9A6_SALPP|nr:INCREASED DNA METHYLATION 2 [Salix purpurea]